jgi:hypothetical protein
MKSMITTKDKLACAKRELQYRRYVYRRRVASGSMSKEQADHEIELMSAIVEDYAKQDAAERPSLFEGR